MVSTLKILIRTKPVVVDVYCAKRIFNKDKPQLLIGFVTVQLAVDQSQFTVNSRYFEQSCFLSSLILVTILQNLTARYIEHLCVSDLDERVCLLLVTFEIAFKDVDSV